MGLSADAAMALLREAMEGILPQELVAETIFEALGEYGGDIPVDGRSLSAFVHGPLSRALERAVDAQSARSVAAHLAPILAMIVASELPPPPPPPPPPPEDTPPLFALQPYVLILASDDGLERRLRLALGDALDVATASGVVAMHAKILGHSPRLVVVDATAPPTFEPAEIARALARNVPGSLTAVWGAQGVYVDEVLRLAREPRPLGLDPAEGVGPLIDLARTFGTAAHVGEPAATGHERAVDGQQRPTPRIGTLGRATPSER